MSKPFFVRYERNSTNYRLFDPASKTIKLSKNVTFNETWVAANIHPQPIISLSGPEY